MALTTAQAVEKAIRIAQDAVKADEAGTLEEAIALYTQSVDLISLGLQNQSASEEVDNTVLHKYKKLYADRIDELRHSLLADVPGSRPFPGESWHLQFFLDSRASIAPSAAVS